jgi:hypothetical protein
LKGSSFNKSKVQLPKRREMKKFEKTESERRLPLRLHNSSPSLLWGVISFVQKVDKPLKWNRQKVRCRVTFDRLASWKSAAAPV